MTNRNPTQHLGSIELAEADVSDIADLYTRCADYFLLQDGEPGTLQDAHELFKDVPPGKRPDDQIVLGWRDATRLNAVAAILRDYPQDGTWYLGFILIDPAMRGQGLGRSICKIIEEFARKSGANEIRLAVLEANHAGERFWRSLGFEEFRQVGPDQFKRLAHRRLELRRSLGSISEVSADIERANPLRI